jgi:hypothetical protein
MAGGLRSVCWRCRGRPAGALAIGLATRSQARGAQLAEDRAACGVVRRLALQAQERAGWVESWPFIPADVSSTDFLDALALDPCLDVLTLLRVLAASHALGAVSRTCAQACLSSRQLMLRRVFPAPCSHFQALGGDPLQCSPLLQSVRP